MHQILDVGAVGVGVGLVFSFFSQELNKAKIAIVITFFILFVFYLFFICFLFVYILSIAND
jgi:hypothetical protein